MNGDKEFACDLIIQASSARFSPLFGNRAKLSQIIIYLGEYDTKDLDKTEILPKETLGVLERKIHPQFKYMLTQPDR